MTPQMIRMIETAKKREIKIYPLRNLKEFGKDHFGIYPSEEPGVNLVYFHWNDESGNTWVDAEVEEKPQSAFCGALDATCKHQDIMRCNDTTDKCEYKQYAPPNTEVEE